jgi:predicted membrane channel-forming protein YqfA (hemolysin III family)
VCYWHDPKLGWRRNLDLVFAKISFAIYFGCGLYNIPKNENMLYFSAVMILTCYGISNYFWTQKIRYWVYVHMIFHMFVAFGQFTVVDTICE